MVGNTTVVKTQIFSDWLDNLKDVSGRAAVLARLTRLQAGNWGDCAPVGGGVSELRINKGPGYRVYCWKDGATIVVALGGGTKKGQQADIDAALAMVRDLKKE